jgi:hypothetical protein
MENVNKPPEIGPFYGVRWQYPREYEHHLVMPTIVRDRHFHDFPLAYSRLADRDAMNAAVWPKESLSKKLGAPSS